MDDDAPGDVSLSMIDVITNGLASLLVLLFLLLMTKGQMTWAAKMSRDARSLSSADDPLVILVTSDAPEPLWTGEVSPWQIETDPAHFAKEHGPRYAAAYFRRPPTAGEEVRLQLPATNTSCRAEVVAPDRPPLVRSFGPEDAGKLITLWPIASLDNEEALAPGISGRDESNSRQTTDTPP